MFGIKFKQLVKSIKAPGCSCDPLRKFYNNHIGRLISDIQSTVEFIEMKSVRPAQLMSGCSDVTKTSQRRTQHLHSVVVVISDEHTAACIHDQTVWYIQLTSGRAFRSAVRVDNASSRVHYTHAVMCAALVTNNKLTTGQFDSMLSAVYADIKFDRSDQAATRCILFY